MLTTHNQKIPPDDSLIAEHCVMFKTIIEDGKHLCDVHRKVKSNRCLRHSIGAVRP